MSLEKIKAEFEKRYPKPPRMYFDTLIARYSDASNPEFSQIVSSYDLRWQGWLAAHQQEGFVLVPRHTKLYEVVPWWANPENNPLKVTCEDKQ